MGVSAVKLRPEGLFPAAINACYCTALSAIPQPKRRVGREQPTGDAACRAAVRAGMCCLHMSVGSWRCHDLSGMDRARRPSVWVAEILQGTGGVLAVKGHRPIYRMATSLNHTSTSF